RRDRGSADEPATVHAGPPLHPRSARGLHDRGPVIPAPLALTLGDPAGVGPEIVAPAWRARKPAAPWFLVGDAALLEPYGIPVTVIDAADQAAAALHAALPALRP